MTMIAINNKSIMFNKGARSNGSLPLDLQGDLDNLRTYALSIFSVSSFATILLTSNELVLSNKGFSDFELYSSLTTPQQDLINSIIAKIDLL